MATVRVETFDAEMFEKLVALFDSGNAAEAESSFRKAMLMCAKHGARFRDAAATVFSSSDARVAELEKELREQQAEHASEVEEAEAEVQRLRRVEAELRAELRGERPGGEHVIDLRGRLRRAWKFPQFRLFLLTLATAATVALVDSPLGPLFGLLINLLSIAWSLGQFRKRGLAQMLLKWLVYYGTLGVAWLVLHSLGRDNNPSAILPVLPVALVLTLSKFSEWLGEMIHAHVWESRPVRAVRRWF